MKDLILRVDGVQCCVLPRSGVGSGGDLIRQVRDSLEDVGRGALTTNTHKKGKGERVSIMVGVEVISYWRLDDDLRG